MYPYSSARPNPDRHPFLYSSSETPIREATVALEIDGRLPVNRPRKRIGKAIRIGRSPVKVSTSAKDSASVLSNPMNGLSAASNKLVRTLRSANASSTASRAILVASPSADGRGRSNISSCNAFASAADVDATISIGGEGGREGGSLSVNRPDGGVIGGVPPDDAGCFLDKLGNILGEPGGEVGGDDIMQGR